MPTTVRVAIVGATGYAGEELLRLLLRHPHVQLAYLAASAKWERPTPASVVFPRLAGQLTLPIESLDPTRLDAVDTIFLALPHGGALSLAPRLIESGKRVIDLSGDFRLRDPALYPTWYQYEHPAPALLHDPRVAYGLTEYYREAIARARLIANPGCYATSVLLGVLPLFEAGLVDEERVMVDAKSGLSGAGRKADEALLFTEMTENLRAYKVHRHQHMPEITQAIAGLTHHTAVLGFVPQVIPASRGLVSTIYARVRGTTAAAIEQVYRARYTPQATPCVRVYPAGTLPQMKDVVGTNYCDIGFVYDPALESLVVMSVIDNLTKGAAGQAVQNFNLMHGFPETTALL
jgi:N-acetyl-gamma-glutamyl-phosphate reductase